MNSSQISAFIENPSLITANDVDSLKNLANEYSYSETLQFLYLYAVSKHVDMKFDDALLATAYRITHRERIVELLDESNSMVFTAEELPSEDQVEEIIDSTPSVEAAQEEISTITETETKINTEPLSIEEITSSETEKTKEVDELEKLVYHTTATALEQDYLAAQGITEIAPTAETNAEEAIESEDHSTSSVEEKAVEPEKEISIETPISSDSKMSFTSWLHQNHQTDKPDKDTPTDSAPVKKYKEEIIDRFIETQPRISKPTAEFYSASKKAKESLDANRNPVSETLAKIFEAQGNYQKAIHVYHQLILNYPEKKSLFAPRIEELKNKISQ